jgi:type IV pilus assembly protein PilB
MTLVKRDIGELLVDNGQISPEELERAVDEKAKSGEPMSAVLERLGLADERQLENALELEYGVNYVSLKKVVPNRELLSTAGESLCREYEAVPISKDSTRLTLAMVTPSNQAAIEIFKGKFLQLQIKPVVCLDADMAEFFAKAFGSPQAKVDGERPKVSNAISEASERAAEPISAEQPEGATRNAQEDMAVALLGNHILANAISRGCSNIHIEPTEKEVLVHYRKDGVLFAARRLPKALLPVLVDRFKTMAEISLSEKEMPQDGRLNVQVSGEQLSFRLSVIPGGQGEHLVIWLD